MLDLASQLAMPVKEVAPIASKPEDVQKTSPKRPGVNMKEVLTKGVGGVDTEELMLEVTCGQNQAALYMSRLQLGSKGTCVLFENAWLTPNEFQYISGRETAKDWKRSIKHHGKSLKVLISKGILTTTPLRCNCGQCSQTKDKDVSKYIVGDDAKMAAGPMRGDNTFGADASKLKSADAANDLGDRRYFRIPGDSNEKLREGALDSPSKPSQRPHAEQCLPGHSPDGARYLSSCDKGLYGAAMVNGGGLRFEGYNPLASGCSPQGGSVGLEMRKTSPDATDAKLKAKKKTDENEDCVKEQFGFRGSSQVNEDRKMEAGKGDVTESSPSNTNGQKKCSSSCIRPATSVDPGPWGHTVSQAEQAFHQESNGCKLTPHDKSKKSSTLNSTTSSSSSERPSCSQLNSTNSMGKSSLPCTGSGVVDPTRLVPSDPSFLFPSFGSHYYPMMTAPQLPAYYANPYVWPVPFATNPSSCSYGWTSPSSDLTASNCLRSPIKESIDSAVSNAAEQAFNFPWMKRANYPFTSSESQPREVAADPIGSSGKRKLGNDASDYLPPAKHPFYIHDGLRPGAFGDAMTWPGYNPSMFLPYNLSSYIPDGRPTHGMFANTFMKGAENPAGAGLGLYSGFFPSPCLGVNSR